jgi:predicted DNA-binding transcriptional regulator AlpA
MNDPKRLLTSKQLRERLGGVSAMALWRWGHNPELRFPKPIVINNFRYWHEHEIEAWLEARREVA